MKKYFLLLLCGTFAVASAQDNEEAQFSKRLAKVAQNLDTDGVFFSLKNSEGDLKDSLEQLDKIFTEMELKMEMGITPNLKLAEISSSLGLDHLLASGVSSKEAKPHWHNRTFYLTDGKHEGLWSLFGEKARAWEAPLIAPAGTDLLLEFDLDLRKTEALAKKIARDFGAEKDLIAAFSQQISPAGLTLSDLLKGFTVRTSLIYWEDETESFDVNQALTLPVPHLAIRMDNAQILWKAGGKELLAQSEVRREDDVITAFSSPTETPFGPRQMMLRYEEKTGVLWFALQEDDYKHCQEKEARLSAKATFQKAVNRLPETGQGMAYISAEMCQTLQKMAGEVGKMLPPDAAFVGGLLEGITAALNSPDGYAAAMAMQENGLLLASNSPYAQKSASMNSLASIASVSALAGLATPVILKAQKTATLAKDTNNLRQISTLFLLYEQDFGAYPENLGQLVEKGYLEAEAAKVLQLERYTYYPGHDSLENGLTIVLSSPPSDGKVAYARVDSSIQQKREEEFKTLLAKQLDKDSK